MTLGDQKVLSRVLATFLWHRHPRILSQSIVSHDIRWSEKELADHYPAPELQITPPKCDQYFLVGY